MLDRVLLIPWEFYLNHFCPNEMSHLNCYSAYVICISLGCHRHWLKLLDNLCSKKSRRIKHGMIDEIWDRSSGGANYHCI